MNEERLTQILHEIAHEEIPDDVNMWPSIQIAARQTSRWRRLIPRTRVGWAAILVAVLLTACAGAYAVNRFLLDINDPGLEAVDYADLITYFNETQTIGNVSVTLEYAYADANRITIAYHGIAQILPSSGSTPGFTGAILSDDSGHVFRSMFGSYGGEFGGEEHNASETAISFAAVSNYDATIMENTDQRLNLHLELTVGEISELVELRESAIATRLPADQPFEPTGPFSFEFTIPISPGLVMDEPQTVTASEIPITLNRIVVTPSLTRLELCFPQLENGSTAIPLTSLSIDDEPIFVDTRSIRNGVSNATNTECSNYLLQVALHDHPGEWTLTIEELLLQNDGRDEGTIIGPWTFAFSME